MTDQNESIEINKSKSWAEALENEIWVTPIVDISESADNFTFIANMPWVSKDNLKIKLEDQHLFIMGRIDYENVINKNYILKESETGNYYRKIKLSEGIDSNKIDAQFVDGQLFVILAKHKSKKSRKIEIKQ